MTTAVELHRYRPTLRASEVREIARRCSLSTDAAALLGNLDVHPEMLIDRIEHLAAVMELRDKGLAEAHDHAEGVRVTASIGVRSIMQSIRNIVAMEQEIERLTRRREQKAKPSQRATRDRRDNAPLSIELERAIVQDALSIVDAMPHLPAASEVRVYLRSGPRFVRVFWVPRRIAEDRGSILHFVEKATGRVYQARSARQVGRFTGRVVGGEHAGA
jgi:hypothetical protein